MTSINTNRGALDAAQAVAAGARELDRVQDRIATGLKVAGPKDNAAIFAIAQKMRAELSGRQAVGDSLARAQSVLSVASAAAGRIADILVEMRQRAAMLADVSLDASAQAAVRGEIAALVRQIDQAAGAATFGGLNLLMPITEPPVSLGGSGPGPFPNINFSALADGRPGLIRFDYRWYNVTPSPAPTASMTGTVTSPSYQHGVYPTYGQTTNFSVSLPYGDWQDFSTISPSLVTFAAHADPFPIPAPPALPPPAAYGAELMGVTHTPFRTHEQVLVSPDGGKFDMTYRPMTSEWLGLSDLATATPDAVLDRVRSALEQATVSAGRMGTELRTVEGFQAQNRKLQDTVETGIGNLVDADLGREGAALQAAQARQALAVRSLGIANAGPEWLLGLFKR